MSTEDVVRISDSQTGTTLRDAEVSDIDSYLRWLSQGEWREYDAPWERLSQNADEATIRQGFTQSFLLNHQTPRRRLIISTGDDQPLGWVNRYDEPRFPDTCYVGICICEDDSLGRGVGTEALRLWVDYLFANSNLHRIGFHTYDFNQRMIRVAEKLGFTAEGADREIIEWQGKWVDRLHFGMLRSEWEAR